LLFRIQEEVLSFGNNFFKKDKLEKQILLSIENVSLKKVGLTDSLIKSGILDSITLVDLAVELEKTFDLSIPFTDLNENNFETAEKINLYLHQKKQT